MIKTMVLKFATLLCFLATAGAITATLEPAVAVEGQKLAFRVFLDETATEEINLHVSLEWLQTVAGSVTYGDGTFVEDATFAVGDTEVFVEFATKPAAYVVESVVASALLSINDDLANPVDLVVDPALVTGTVTQDQTEMAQITAMNVTGTEDEGILEFNLTASRITVQTLNVICVPVSGTAISDIDAKNDGVHGDFTQVDSQVTFPSSGARSNIKHKLFRVFVLNDNIQEEEKYFMVNFDVVSEFKARYETTPAFGILTDYEGLTITLPAMVTSSESDAKMQFPITMSHITEKTEVVTAFFQDGGAQDSVDYEVLVSQVTIPGGRSTTLERQCPPNVAPVTACIFTVQPVDDVFIDPSVNDFLVFINDDSFSEPLNYSKAGSVLQSLGQIDDDEKATVSLTDFTGKETDGVFTFNVSLSHPLAPGNQLTWTASTREQTATSADTGSANVDFTPIVTEFSMTGENYGIVEVQVVNDDVQEADEYFVVDLVLAPGYPIAIDTVTATGSLVDDNECPTLNISNGTWILNGAGTERGSMEFDIVLSHAFQRSNVVDRQDSITSASVFAQTQDGSAIGGADYTAKGERVRFPFLSKLQKFTVELLGDSLPENEESFTVVISDANPTAELCDPAITTSTGTGVIVDDDPEYFLEVEGGRGSEASGGADFVVNLVDEAGNPHPNGAPIDLSFRVTTKGCEDVFDCKGMATGRNTDGSRGSRNSIQVFDGAILDYGSISTQRIVMLANTSTATFRIPITEDRIVEPEEETFDVYVASLDTFYSIPTAKVVASIESDDVGTVTIQDAVAQEGDSHLHYQFSFSSLVEGIVQIVTEDTKNGTAVPGVDYTDTDGGSMSVTVPTYACNPVSVVDFACELSLTLSGSAGDIIDTGPAKTIINVVESVKVGNFSEWPGSDARLTPNPVSFVGSIFRSIVPSEVWIEDAAATEGGEEELLFPVYLSKLNLVDVTVRANFVGVTAGAAAPSAGCFEGQDYTLPPTCQLGNCDVTFVACASAAACQNETLPRRANISVTIIDDPISEAKVEQVDVTLESVLEPPGGVVVVRADSATASILITDNDDAVVSISGAEGSETTGSIEFPVVLSAQVDRPVSLTFAFTFCTASDIANGVGACAFGSSTSDAVEIDNKMIYPDFQIPASGVGEMTMQPLVNNGMISVPVYNDPVQECDESFTVEINTVTVDAPATEQYRVGNQPLPEKATGMITDDNEGMSLTFITNATGLPSAGPFEFVVMVSHQTSNSFTFGSSGSDVANAAGRFFSGSSPSVVAAQALPANYTISLPILESNQKMDGVFKMNVNTIDVVSQDQCEYPFSGGGHSGVGTILPESTGPSNELRFSNTMFEGEAGTDLMFNVTLAMPADGDVPFNFKTSNFQAIAAAYYLPVDDTFVIPDKEVFIMVPVKLLSNKAIVTPDLMFNVTITSSAAVVTVGSALGMRAREGSATLALTTTTAINIEEGDSYTMTVTCFSTIQADAVQMVLETDGAEGCTSHCALAGIDYVDEVFMVEWTAQDGLIRNGSKSTNFTVQTIIDPATAHSLAFAVRVTSITAGNLSFSSDSYFNKNITIDTTTGAPHVTNWNCPPPFKFVSEGKSTVGLTFTTLDTVEFGFILPVYALLAGCFVSDHEFTLASLPKSGSAMEISDDVLYIDYRTFTNFGAKFFFTVSATDMVTNETSSFQVDILLAITEVQTLEQIQSNLAQRQRSVGDYYVYQIQVPKSVINYDTCKKVIGLNKRLSGDPPCCTVQQVLGGDRDDYPDGNSAAEILTCYVLPIMDVYDYDLIFDVRATSPGKSTACVGDTVVDPIAQCFELFAYGVQTVNWIPDQYVAKPTNGDWTSTIPVVINGVRTNAYDIDVYADGIESQVNFVDGHHELVMTGTTAGMFQVTVVTHALGDDANAGTKGRTFWVYVFDF